MSRPCVGMRLYLSSERFCSLLLFRVCLQASPLQSDADDAESTGSIPASSATTATLLAATMQIPAHKATVDNTGVLQDPGEKAWLAGSISKWQTFSDVAESANASAVWCAKLSADFNGPTGVPAIAQPDRSASEGRIRCHDDAQCCRFSRIIG